MTDIALTFTRRASQNIGKWGLQDYKDLALQIAEEAGEVAQAVLQHEHEDGQESRIFEETVDLGALCCQMIYRYEDREPVTPYGVGKEAPDAQH